MNESSRVQQDNTHFSRSKSLHVTSHQTQNETEVKTHGSVHQCDQEDGVGEIFGVILSRSRSVSSAAPSRETTKAEKQRGLMQTAAKVTLTMKRSFSVSGGYCRIHDQHDIINDGGENMNPNVFQKRTVKKKGKILKACMRLLGL